MSDISVLPVPRSLLGETPIWCADEQSLYWIDCDAPAVFRRHAVTGEMRRWDAPSKVEGMVMRQGGGVLAVLRTGVFVLGPTLQDAKLLAPAPFESDHLFLHEARCDPAGRLWIGLIDSEAFEREPSGMTLFRLDGHRLVEQATGVVGSVANGMAWSRDGTSFYLADSLARTVWRFAYSVATGTLSDKQLFAQFNEDDGYPDGAAVDADDGYWVAMAAGGKVLRLNPDGSRDRYIEVPTALPTAVAFGGPTLERMFVTSIGSKHVLPAVRRGEHDGGLFELNANARGLREPCFRG
jgi:sugar lactone lactonase YvrE